MRQHKQFFKILVVGALVALMSVNVTLARGWGWPSNRCCPRVCAPRPVCGYGWSDGWGGYRVGPVYYSSGRYSSGRIVIDAPLIEGPVVEEFVTPAPALVEETASEPAPESTDPMPETPPMPESSEAPTEPALPETPPVFEPPLPIDEMPAVESAPEIDDLFAPTTPVEEADKVPIEDLFGPPPTPVEESEEPPAVAPLVEELTAPADDALPVEEPSAEASEFNDLFGPPPTPDEEPEETPAEAEELPGDPAIENELFDDPQAASSTSVPGGLTSTELRNWTDATLRYTIRGRLLWVKEGKARILKETGRTTTLAVTQLCKADRQFVQAQAVAALKTLDIDNHTAQNR